MTEEVVSKSQFAELAGVSRARVAQWLADRKIRGDAIVGVGHRARIRVAVAKEQLRRNLDPSQHLGFNGKARVDAVTDTVEVNIKTARLQQLELSNAKAAAEADARSGRYMRTDAARQEMGRVAARLMSTFEASLTEFAAAIVAPIRRRPRATRYELYEPLGGPSAAGPPRASRRRRCHRLSRTTMLIANPERIGLETVAAALMPPPPLDLLAWAEQNIAFDDGPFPGPYSRQLFPFFDAVLRALGPDDPCRFVTVTASAQVGKTALATIFALASMTEAQGSFLVVHPTTDNAIRWSKMKLAPMMRSTAAVREAFPQRANDSTASVLYKERKDGLARLLITGANSPASLSQVTITAQVQDDVSKYEVNTMGDPELMADSRSRAMPDAKIFKISTPLVSPGCRITRNFLDGSQELPFVPCPHCGTKQILEWENMLANLDPANPDDAHFTCGSCGTIIEEHHRPAMLAGFEWRAHNPAASREHRSFWIWSAYSYLQSWGQIAREWLKAKGDPAGEKTFFNDALGKAYETRGDGRPWEELRDRANKSDYTRGTVPKGALLLFLGIDCQLDRCEWVLLGAGEHYRRYIVDCGTIGKHISEPDAQRHIDLLLAQTWKNAHGHDMGIMLAAIDANWQTDIVLAYARRYSPSRLIAVRGIAGDSAPRIARIQRERNEKRGTVLKYSHRFFNIGVNTFKLSLYKDLAKDDSEAPGYVTFPTGLPDRFFQELVSETRVATKRMGQLVYKWEKPDRQANEILDCTIYASAAAIKHGVNWISDQGWQKLRHEVETADAAAPVPSSPGSVAKKLAGAGDTRPTHNKFGQRIIYS